MAGGTGGGETIMATREFAAHEAHAHAAPQGFIRKWVFSLDHKVIGLQYYFLALTAVLVGMFLSLLMRIHLIWPNITLPLLGDIKPETYLTLVTMHGTIMVFFVLTTAPQGGFGNYFLPMQIGAPDMALTVWAWFVTAILGLLAFGVLLSAGILLLMDRNMGTSFFVPLSTINGQLTGHKGGSPLLWQHLFWFFGHLEVYIAILPAMGMCSQLL